MGRVNLLDSFPDWVMDHGLLGLTVGLLAVLVFAAVLLGVIVSPFLIYDAMQPKFSLRKDEWTCTQSHQEIVHSGYMSGKVWVPTTSVITVCDQWSRK